MPEICGSTGEVVGNTGDRSCRLVAAANTGGSVAVGTMDFFSLLLSLFLAHSLLFLQWLLLLWWLWWWLLLCLWNSLLFVVNFHVPSDTHGSIAVAMVVLAWPRLRARIENWLELANVGNWTGLARIGHQWVWPQQLKTRACQDWREQTKVELRREMVDHSR